MDTTIEKSRTYEEIRDEYLPLIYQTHEHYGLAEDDLADLTISYCECIQRNLGCVGGYWPARLRQVLTHRARKLLENRTLDSCSEALPWPTIAGTLREPATGDDQCVEELVFCSQLHSALLTALSSLTHAERSVVEFRYLEKNSIKACGLHLGIPDDAVRRIEVRAFNKLRHHTRRRVLRPFLDGEL